MFNDEKQETEGLHDAQIYACIIIRKLVCTVLVNSANRRKQLGYIYMQPTMTCIHLYVKAEGVWFLFIFSLLSLVKILNLVFYFLLDQFKTK